jgi:predicted dithiol-disulfide oxidoreductase (DUF899 family)
MYELQTESAEYRKLRAELLEAEIALKDQRERVAALRRQLPTDTPVEDYGFRCIDLAGNGAPQKRRLSELFDDADKPLVLMQFMFGEAQTSACPMCTMWADGYDGVIPHLRERLNFGVVVAGDVELFAEHARSRGWRNLRLLSSSGTSFKRDFGMQNAEGGQSPGVSVFTLAANGTPRHFYTGGALMADGHFRGMDLLSPVWSFFDLTPQGRGDWWPSLSYGD